VLYQKHLYAVEKVEGKPFERIKLIFLQGDVEVKLKGEKDWKKARLYMELYPGDKIRTKLASDAELKFEDGSVLKIKENTIVDIRKILFDHLKETTKSSIKLWIGKIKAILESLRPDSTFHIHTPSAIIGVRGTILLVKVERDGSTWLGIEKGEATFQGIKQKKAIVVRRGQCARCDPLGTSVTPVRELREEERRGWDIPSRRPQKLQIKKPPLDKRIEFLKKAPKKPVVFSPSPGVVLKSPVVDILGKTDPEVMVELKVNGRSLGRVESDADGNFIFEKVKLCEAISPRISYSITDYRDFIKEIPEVTVNINVAPPNGRYNLSLVSIAKNGKKSAPCNLWIEVRVGVNLIIGGMQAYLEGPVYVYTYRPPFLHIGQNVIEAQASYEGEVLGRCQINIPFFDPVGPVIASYTEELTPANQLKVILEVFDEGSGIKSVTANGIEMTKVAEGEYEWVYPGPYKKSFAIKIMAEDLAENITYKTLTYDWQDLIRRWGLDLPPAPP
jgi:hypothetical protein